MTIVNHYPSGVGVFRIGLDTDLTTFELRYSGERERSSYLTGLYYLYSKAISDTQVTLSGIDVTQAAKGTTEGYAASANGTLHLDPKWDLSLGARYDHNKSTLNWSVGFRISPARLMIRWISTLCRGASSCSITSGMISTPILQ
jgi:outer membrane receptor protein involved in Fe transport